MHQQWRETLSVLRVRAIADYAEILMPFAQHISRGLSSAWFLRLDTYILDWNISATHETYFSHDLVDVRPDLGILS